MSRWTLISFLIDDVIDVLRHIACVALLVALMVSLIRDDYINAILTGVVYLIVRE